MDKIIFGMNPELMKYSAKTIAKYKKIHAADLMDDVQEKINAIFLKIGDLNEDVAEEAVVLDTFRLWLENNSRIFTNCLKAINELDENK